MSHDPRRIWIHGALAGAWLCLGLLGGAARADGAANAAALAAAGPCAEPRPAPPGAPATGTPEQVDLAIIGAPTDHFSPLDVAAGAPEPVGFAPPEPPGFTRTACDAPDAGCTAVLTNAAGSLVESPSQPSLPPGVER